MTITVAFEVFSPIFAVYPEFALKMGQIRGRHCLCFANGEPGGSKMSKHKDYWDKLQAAILINHKCKSAFRETVFVREKTPAGEILWEGEIEVFDLIGHPEADTCYAWQHVDGDDVLQIFTILGNQSIYSAKKAVQMALFTDPQCAVHALHRKFAHCDKVPAGIK